MYAAQFAIVEKTGIIWKFCNVPQHKSLQMKPSTAYLGLEFFIHSHCKNWLTIEEWTEINFQNKMELWPQCYKDDDW